MLQSASGPEQIPGAMMSADGTFLTGVNVDNMDHT